MLLLRSQKQTYGREVFRRHLQASRQGTFDWSDKDHDQQYAQVYEECKGHIVALTDVVITTTANARCGEVMNHWANCQSDYGIAFNGVILPFDEASKDQEINIWKGIMCEKWADEVKGVFIFGDDKQRS